MAQIAPAPRKLQQTAGWRGKKQAETGAMRSLLFVSLSPSPTQTQTAKVPACHQGHTDGSLLGGPAALQAVRTDRFHDNAVRSYKQSELRPQFLPLLLRCLQKCKGINGQISQIPGLSPSITSLPEERARGRRAGVRESDSDYVKLAKQGGHKGLLWHENTTASQPDAYKPPGWFSAASGDDGQPSLINSEEKKNPGAFQPREPPFGTDNMSAWERDDNSSSSNGKEKNNNVPDSQMVKLESSNQYHETSKFKRIVFDKNPAPVNMSKLLSFGYAEDNRPTANTDLSN
ncbi:uncharacterized protein C7orf57-like [Epinephelus moara]|uniref:uncharacterized protein C7orf57-like n=1 Tax=Epinephelus moara TaxID=300413 RepID=UPI00214ECF80|nr:uncharacterized protein C7orf57-like [Epinephelus moara]